VAVVQIGSVVILLHMEVSSHQLPLTIHLFNDRENGGSFLQDNSLLSTACSTHSYYDTPCFDSFNLIYLILDRMLAMAKIYDEVSSPW
jgi:hypothetical protein